MSGEQLIFIFRLLINTITRQTEELSTYGPVMIRKSVIVLFHPFEKNLQLFLIIDILLLHS